MKFNLWGIDPLIRSSSRLVDALYTFILLAITNSYFPDYELNLYQNLVFAFGFVLLFFDFGRLQHLSNASELKPKISFLNTRFYLFVMMLLCVLILNFYNLLLLAVLLSMFEVFSKNYLYDYISRRNSIVLLTINCLKTLTALSVLFFQFNLIFLASLLLLSILITHLNKDTLKIKENFKNFSSSKYSDSSNLYSQCIMLIKSLLLYYFLKDLFLYNIEESRIILFIYNSSFTFSVILISSILDRIKNVNLFQYLPILLLGSAFYSLVLNFILFALNLNVSSFTITKTLLIAFLTFSFCFVALFSMTKFVVNKKSTEIFYASFISILVFILGSFAIEYFSFESVYILFIYEVSFLLILFTFTNINFQLRESLYFVTHKLNLLHCLELAKNIWRKNIVLSSQCGFGDVLFAIVYAKSLQKKGFAVKVCVHDQKKYPSEFFPGHSVDKKFISTKEGSEDYIEELLNYFNIPFYYGNAMEKGSLYAHPYSMRKLFFEDAFKYSFLKSKQNKHKHIFLHLRNFDTEALLAIKNFLETNFLSTNLIITDASSHAKELLGNRIKILKDYSNSSEYKFPTKEMLDDIGNCIFAIGGRGGMSTIPILMGVPTINIWDKQGWDEWNTLWSGDLFHTNPFGFPVKDQSSIESLEIKLKEILALEI